MMRSVLRGLVLLLVGVVLALGAVWVVLPGERIERPAAFRDSALPDDLDGWLADAEASVPDLRADAAKRIVWAGAPGDRTDLALVFLHGFSASPLELDPVLARTAEALGANLFYQRLAGHGRDGAAMAEPAAEDWLDDVAEAMAVGRRLGDRVVMVGSSTGATLAAALAVDPLLAAHRRDLHGVALVSPNFGVAKPAAELLTWPAARLWAPLVAGKTRRFEPLNASHAEHWTESYPTVAAIPMQVLVEHVRARDWSRAAVPALFYFSPDDRVVDPAATEAVIDLWGGPTTVERVAPMEGTDPSNHVIAGDILSPARTDAAIALLTGWAKALP